MPQWELQNHIMWCFKRFADFADYVDHDHFSSCHNHSKYSEFKAVAIPVTSFQCNKHAVHMGRCTGSTRYRMHKPLRNDTVHLWMGTSHDSYFNMTSDCNLAWLKYLFVVEDAESSVEGLLALVETFPTGPISETTRMVIIEETHQPPMQPLHDGGHLCKPLFGVWTIYIIPISANQGALHFLPLPLQPDRTWRHLRNTIDLAVCNLRFM